MKKIEFRPTLFWDVNPKKIDLKKTPSISLSALPIWAMIKKRAGR